MKTPLLTAALLAVLPATAHAALPTGNLLKNPGFEQGPTASFTSDPLPIPGWSTSAPLKVRSVVFAPDATSATTYRRSEAAAAGAGCRGLLGPVTPLEGDDVYPGATSYYGWQDVAVPADAVGKTFKLGALLGRLGPNGTSTKDYGAVEAYFLDAAGTETALAADVSNYAAAGAASAELTRKEDASSAVPAGTVALRVYVYSVAILPPDTVHGYANGLVDAVKLTFDAALPADPPAGCQPAVPTTGSAGALTTSTATVDGAIDTRHEDVRYQFRYGANGALDSSTPETDLAATDGSSPVAAALTGLAPGTTYSYALQSRTTIDETTGEPALGAVRTFTTPAAAGPPPPPPVVVAKFQGKIYKGNTFKQAVTIKGPSCVKRGSKFKVSVRDVAEGTRTLRRFFVSVQNGIGKDLVTKGPTGRTSGAVTVKRIYAKAPRNTRGQKLIVSVTADFNGIPDPRGKQFGTLDGSPDSVSGQKQFRFCGAKGKR